MDEEQLQRQDWVDSAIFQMLCDVHPHDGGDMEAGGWDIEMIGEIRDVVQQWFIKKGICTAEEFYPTIEN